MAWAGRLDTAAHPRHALSLQDACQHRRRCRRRPASLGQAGLARAAGAAAHCQWAPPAAAADCQCRADGSDWRRSGSAPPGLAGGGPAACPGPATRAAAAVHANRRCHPTDVARILE